MSNREDRLRSLLDKVRAKRPDERTTRAADALDRIRTASGTTAAVQVSSSPPARVPSFPPGQVSSSPPGQVSSSPPGQVSSSPPARVPSSPVPEPPTSPAIDSPTRYSSQPPQVERPLSAEPRARIRPSSGAPAVGSQPASASQSRRPESIRPQSVAPTGQPVVYATDAPEFPRPKTFGDLLELTLSLRPR
jgi:hypothetical protein